MNRPQNQAVHSALAAWAPHLISISNAQWQFSLINGSSHLVQAKAEGDWLLMETECLGLDRSWSLWDAAVGNATICGLAKLVWSRDNGLRMAAELPVCEAVELTARLKEACEGFLAQGSQETEPTMTVELPRSEKQGVDLKALCADAGWPFTERGSGNLSIDLEASGYQALVAPTRQGLSLSCEVATLDALGEDSREAIAGLLLSLSRRIRMGRASVETSGSSPTVQFEVVFRTMPGPSEISSALESLSVACSLCGEEEIKALQVPAIAESYLALRGWEPEAGRRKERTETV